MQNALIYKIVPKALWDDALAAGLFKGAAIDLKDGYIHFSTNEQLRETLTFHFAGQSGLMVIAFETDRFGDDLVYEASRGGALFPHLYSDLNPAFAYKTWHLDHDENGDFIFPNDFPGEQA